MARKSKRMALYEAIRQGQAKIAKGLESGHMRSDGTVHPQYDRVQNSDKNALLNKFGRIPGISVLSKILAVTIGIAVLMLLLFVIWLVIRPGADNEPVIPEPQAETTSPQQITQQPAVEQAQPPKKEESSGFFGFGGKKAEPQQPVPKPEPIKPSAATGQNVIVITQVDVERRKLLVPAMEYFNANGVPTEMIQRGNILLVTRAGFDYNPSRQGTEGYQLFQRIRQLGLKYPEATGDTKFGIRPFQDAYALKK